ncbi:MAG: hypothetical protein LBC02_14425 [Planctomycetaceae bacterium]|nr:hypothetical protein [Planctomycetaceae bacterium]
MKSISNFRPNTGASRLAPTRCFGETSPTKSCFAEIQMLATTCVLVQKIWNGLNVSV